MSYVRLASFFQLYRINKKGEEVNEGRYNNAIPGESIRHQNLSYDYLSFVYQGAAKNRTGDNLEAQIVMSPNTISTGLAKEAVDNNYMIRVYSALMTDDNTVEKILSKETWVAASLSYDNTALEIILSSAIDAVGANAPTRVLTKEMVGFLPVTGSVRAS